jgi:hypothetical protein
MIIKSRFVFRAAALMIAGAALSGTPSVQAYSAAANPPKASPSAGIALANVAHPEAALTNAKIYDQKGVIIGFVDKVILDSGGKAVELRVDVGNYLGMDTKMVAMMVGDFKFDTGHKTLITNLTNAQIQVIAGAH